MLWLWIMRAYWLPCCLPPSSGGRASGHNHADLPSCRAKPRGLRVGALWAWRAGSDVMAHQEAALDLVDRADAAEILGVSGTPALHRLPRRT